MKGNFKATEALVLLGSTRLELEKKDAQQKWGALVRQQVEEIGRQERMIPRKAVALGLVLHAVKNSMPHGRWTPWLTETLTGLTFWSAGTAKVNASYYMRLAITFVEQCKPAKTEVLAISSGNALATIADPKGAAAKLMSRIDDFIGDRSLNEVLIDEGIKQTGGSGGGGARGSGGAIAADTDTLLEDAGQLFLTFDQILLDPNTLKRFPARQLDEMEQQLVTKLEQFRQLKAKLKPRE